MANAFATFHPKPPEFSGKPEEDVDTFLGRLDRTIAMYPELITPRNCFTWKIAAKVQLSPSFIASCRLWPMRPTKLIKHQLLFTIMCVTGSKMALSLTSMFNTLKMNYNAVLKKMTSPNQCISRVSLNSVEKLKFCPMLNNWFICIFGKRKNKKLFIRTNRNSAPRLGLTHEGRHSLIPVATIIDILTDDTYQET